MTSFVSLRGLNMLRFLPPVFIREIIFLTSWLLSCIPILLEKGVHSTMENIAPKGCQFFPFRVVPFSEGEQNNFDRVASHEFLHSPLTDFYHAQFYVTNYNAASDTQIRCEYFMSKYKLDLSISPIVKTLLINNITFKQNCQIPNNFNWKKLNKT